MDVPADPPHRRGMAQGPIGDSGRDAFPSHIASSKRRDPPGLAAVADLPGLNRVFVTFTDANGVLRGEASVAVRTQ
jgi:hypothetical protein